MFWATNILKYKKRRNIWESGSLSYDPANELAYSYRWCFVKRINGKIIFNNYNYSPTTTRHQSAMLALLRQLKIKIDLFVDTRESLNTADIGKSALNSEVVRAIPNNDFRKALKIAKVFKIKLTQKLINELTERLEIQAAEKYLKSAFKYQEDKIQEVLKRLDAPKYYAPVDSAAPIDRGGSIFDALDQVGQSCA